MKSLFLYSIQFLIMFQEVYCQSRLPSLDYVPVSPGASSFSRYGEIPIDHSTGVPRIEIPIHIFNIGEVEIPISISYHSSGIKVRDIATEIGLGFVLNTGGVITKTIIGNSDVDNLPPVGSYNSANDIKTAIDEAHHSTDQIIIRKLAEKFWMDLTFNSLGSGPSLRDNYSDRYNYNLSTGESGVFRRDFIMDSIRLMPYFPIDVNINGYNIIITSSNGYKNYFTSPFGKDLYTLRKVVNANSSDSLMYHYRPNNYNGYPNLNMNYNIYWAFEEPYYEYTVGCIGVCEERCVRIRNGNYSYPDHNGGLSYSLEPILDSIVSRNEVLIFEYSNRSDIQGYRLVKIILKDRYTRETKRVFDLFHNYFGTQADKNLRLRLDSVSISGNNSSNKNTYSFKYNESVILPAYPHLIDDLGVYPNIWYEDYWGYYNGILKNSLFPDFISTFAIPNVHGLGVSIGGMEPNGNYAQACILKEIKYPTGGKTIFEFEPNTLTANVGGVRIKTISSYTDENALAFVKSYSYNDAVYAPLLPWYYRYDSPQDHYLYFQEGVCINEIYYQSYLAFSNSLRPITVGNGAPIVYTRVTEYFGDPNSNIGKIIYDYQDPGHPDSRDPLPGDIDTRYINFYNSDQGNYVPRLLGKTFFRYNNGTYDTIRAEFYKYKNINEKIFNTGTSIASKIVLENWETYDYQALYFYDDEYTNESEYLLSLVYLDTKGYQFATVLDKSHIVDYTDDSKIQTTTTHYYENKYSMLRSSIETCSDGKFLIIDYKYPFDFDISPYVEMTNKRMLTPVIEQNYYKENKLNLIQQFITNYNIYSNNIFAPSSIQIKNSNLGSLESRVAYHNYDQYGNILSVSKDGGPKVGYIWGYNYTYPIAKVINATETQIAYNSFEEIGGVVDINSKTGKKVCNSNYSFSMSSLTPGKYILSYWKRTNGVWAMVTSEVTIAGTSYNTVISASSATPIDEVRFYPSNAQMTTYTYEPLIGMTSMTDENGQVTSFEYDTFNRLKLVRDSELNILQKYDYHYKQ